MPKFRRRTPQPRVRPLPTVGSLLWNQERVAPGTCRAAARRGRRRWRPLPSASPSFARRCAIARARAIEKSDWQSAAPWTTLCRPERSGVQPVGPHPWQPRLPQGSNLCFRRNADPAFVLRNQTATASGRTVQPGRQLQAPGRAFHFRGGRRMRRLPPRASAGPAPPFRGENTHRGPRDGGFPFHSKNDL